MLICPGGPSCARHAATNAKSLHYVFRALPATLLLWNYPVMDRFLLLFVPLFCVGLWVEGKPPGGLARGALRAGGSGERVFGRSPVGGLGRFGRDRCLEYLAVLSAASLPPNSSAAPKAGQAQAMNWIRKNALREDRIGACVDVGFTSIRAAKP